MSHIEESSTAPSPPRSRQAAGAVAGEAKELLVTRIRAWIKIENEMKQLQAELRKRREAKKDLTNALVDVMKTNDIDCFDINNGKLVYSQTKVKTPLNKAQLMAALIKYYADDVDTAKEMSDYLLSARNEKVKETIRMKSFQA